MKRSRKYDDRKLQWLRDGEKFAVILIIMILLFRFVIGISWVDGQSMYPTLHNRQLLLYSRIVKDFERGDIVAVRFQNPQGDGTIYMVKRIVATEGDTVDIKGGIVYINGEPEPDSEKRGPTAKDTGQVQYPVRLGRGQIFVLGDNRETTPEGEQISQDSRKYGILSETEVIGKVFLYINHDK